MADVKRRLRALVRILLARNARANKRIERILDRVKERRIKIKKIQQAVTEIMKEEGRRG